MKDYLKVNENKITQGLHGLTDINFIGCVHSALACLLLNG